MEPTSTREGGGPAGPVVGKTSAEKPALNPKLAHKRALFKQREKAYQELNKTKDTTSA